MLTNLIKLALRNLWKKRVFSFINIFGLALGMACFFLTLIYCEHEFNYDRFHSDGERLYRVEYRINLQEEINSGRIPPTIGPAIRDYFPEVESVARFYERDLSIKIPEDQSQFELENVFFVDSTATKVFKFDFIHGDPRSALHRPASVVLSDVTALQLFGTTDVIGNAIQLAGEDGFQISGVVKAWPDNSHLEFTMLLPYSTMIMVEPQHTRELTQQVLENNWIATHSYTYVKLKSNQNYEIVNKKFAAFLQEKGDERFRDKQSFSLLPVSSIHLESPEGGPKPPGNRGYLYLFILVGLLTLAIACINFVNLATASSMARAKEVGVRKVLGAQRQFLILQFLGESLLLSFIAFIISLSIAYFSLPYLNDLTNTEIPFPFSDAGILSLFFLVFIITGILAGLYPAFFISGFKAVSILKGRTTTSGQSWNNWLRQGLITLQFIAAIGFIGGAAILFLQLKYLKEKPLGFHEDLQLSLPINSGNNINAVFRPGDANIRARMNSFDESLLAHSNIRAVTQCYRPPGLGAVARNVWNEHVTQEDNFFARILAVDYDYVETYDLTLVAGRDFDQSFGTDHISSFMVNEQAVKALGWTDPQDALGKQMTLEGKEGSVVGVLKDFNYADLRSEVDPLVMEVRPGSFGYFGVRLQNADIPETLKFIEAKWKEAFPEKVFEYSFLDETINEAYIAERRLSKMIGIFAGLAIFISCFGLFGLTALLTQQRFKEIGIRKVLGASIGQILAMMAKDFIKLIGVALLIATPLTWFLVKDWLAEFAYRIDFPWWVTISSGILVMLIAFLTISSQSLRAATAHPAEAIREE
ncbi:MAG: FtsX-like permease family protein [Saprospiraceae bacterium]|nr:FtsX-like permease family protein [Saprospiraceae bacterium]